MERREFLKIGFIFTAGVSIMGCQFFFEDDDDEQILEKNTDEKGGNSELKETSEKEQDHIKKEEGAEESEYSEEAGGENQENVLSEQLIPRRILGRTGLSVSIFSLGGAFTLAESWLREDAAIIINRAMDLGVNYIDTARSYRDSEKNIGAAIKGRRHEIYLASKTNSRSYDNVMRDIEDSLRNLQTDYIDVYQLHGIHSDDDIKDIFKRDGAVNAIEELKAQGLIRYTGITAHKNYPVVLRAMEGYDFDTLLMPLNPGEVHSDSFIKNVLPVAMGKNMGVIAMKVAAYGRLFISGGIKNMEESLRYVLSYPIHTATIGISNINEVERNALIAKGFKPYSHQEMLNLEAVAKPFQREANFFKYEW